MIKLKDILKELDYGDKLWADPLHLDDWNYEKFLKYLYGDGDGENYTEKDTYWEEEMFWRIKNYIEDEKEITFSSKDKKDLLFLKKHFPKMLDPYGFISGDIYRGMTSPIKDVIKYIKKAKDIEWYGSSGKYIYLVGVNTTLTSRGTRGFISATTDVGIALGFMSQSNIHSDPNNDRWPITGVTNYDKVAGVSVMNPEFVNIMTNMSEDELFILDSKFPARDIIIGSPEHYGSKTPNIWVEQGRLIVQALKDKGFDYD
jgi:hypothetical protein